MSGFVLKIVACIAMLIGHIPFAKNSLAIPCIYIGKLAFPIFAFLISEGYIHTKSFSNYLKRLLILAVISQVPAYLLFFNDFSSLYLNIYFTLALGLLAIRCWDKIQNKYISSILVILIAVIAEALGCDFGAIGVLMITAFYITKNKKIFMTFIEIFLMLCLYSEKMTHYAYTVANIRYVLFQFLFSIISLLFIILYNGKRGKDNKAIQAAFYLFYPIHLIILCFIK